MEKRLIAFACAVSMMTGCAYAAKVNAEKSCSVNGMTRKYVLYVPDNVSENAPLVFSLHGAGGHDTDRSPFRTDVADQAGCIVVYPQGNDQNFSTAGMYTTGWNSTGFANEELDFFKAIIEAVAKRYSIDQNRIYCCGFSNGGMMTYSNSSSACDIFAAFASISGFQLNEFHLRTIGSRPVPFLHIHGKADDFVKYSCMPVIRDGMIARNGCNPVAEETEVPGRYKKSVFAAEEGGFPYVYYEVDGMYHVDYTDSTEDGNSALTMWNFMSKYTLDSPCDRTLKWRLNIDAEGYNARGHKWKVSNAKTRYEFGTPRRENNADNNVYPSLQFEGGNYKLMFASEGDTENNMYVKLETLYGSDQVFCISAKVGDEVIVPFTVPAYDEFKITIVKTDENDKFTRFAVHSCEEAAEAVNCNNAVLPDEEAPTDPGKLVEIPQDQGKQYDDFARADLVKGSDYNTYTATGDLQIAFKMMNVEVSDCDYVVIKFAEPVAAGWNLAFWDNTNLVPVPEGSTEYIFELEPDMMESGILPQICMMTFFGGFQAPLTAKVIGVYKHSIKSDDTSIIDITTGKDAVERYSIDGRRVSSDEKGVVIEKYSDGSTRKLIKR